MKVGEYVRTDNCIGKVYDICHKEEDYYKFIIENHGTLRICDSDYIVKSSPNIIDLIEVGDYVNGSKVVKIEKHNEELYVYVQETEYCNACDEEENIYYKEDAIKLIVTKEQFSQMEYRIGE